MKVKDLMETLNKYVLKNPRILEYDVYTEQLTEEDKNFKCRPIRKDIPWSDKENGQGWNHIKDSDGWNYFEVAGFNTVFDKEKIFTINVNF
jgi:hypothetical protein